MPKKFYITTPIYYVNDVPHIGHAYTTIAADVLLRYYKSKGEDVFLLTGVDEHGAKIAAAAKAAGKEPKVFVDSLVPRFQEAWKNLNIKYSEFFRTTNPQHEKIVQEFISKLKDRGFIEKRKYEGLYCTDCEKFLMPDELVDGCCPDHGTKPEKHSEENYFFLLSKFQKDLLLTIEAGGYQILPESRKNEIIGKIKQRLEDVSISRQKVEWGIPFPGDESQTIYVWIDALINYFSEEIIYKSQISNLKSQNSGDNYFIFPPDIQLMAKDILWFHAIVWPAMLLALDLELPKKVFAHGFFTVGGQKMSKTRGNVLDPNKLVQKFGADAVRYALLREFPFGEDGDISEEKIAQRYENELAHGLGNLLQRTLTMINHDQDTRNKIQETNKFEIRNSKFETNPKSKMREISKLIEELKFDQALEAINAEVARLNQFIDQNKPWELAKSDRKKLEVVLSFVIQSLSSLVSPLSCFMPSTAAKMKHQLEILEPEPLFPRIES